MQVTQIPEVAMALSVNEYDFSKS